MGSQRVGHDWATSLSLLFQEGCPRSWRRSWPSGSPLHHGSPSPIKMPPCPFYSLEVTLSFFPLIILCDLSVDLISYLRYNQRFQVSGWVSNIPLSSSPRRHSFTIRLAWGDLPMKFNLHFHKPKAKILDSFFFLPQLKQFIARQLWQELRLFMLAPCWQNKEMPLILHFGFDSGSSKVRRSSHFSKF